MPAIARWLTDTRRALLLGALTLLGSGASLADLPATIDRIKPSVVVVGTFNKLRSPQFLMRGTGFAVGDGSLIATNAHVIPAAGSGETADTLAVLVRRDDKLRPIEVRLLVRDTDHDLAILRLTGTPLPALTLRPSAGVREGQSVAFTGFPIGGALGFSPVTHRGVISAITPIAQPGNNAQSLRDAAIHRLRNGAFPVFQLDATAYPGNSGGPLYDPDSGEVLGVVNSVLVKESKESVLEKPSGISYAIPADHLKVLMSNIRQ